MATPTYNVDYEDERFQQVEQDKSNALSDLENTYAGMIGQSDKYYQDQIDASKQWAETQQQQQQQQTQHTIDQINQQKDQQHKDYIKEQSGAYVDWQKQSNEYGTEAEKMASSGLANTGYSESSQVSMYNTYQNRVAQAREAFVQATLNYDNAIKDAQLQNSSVLAEIAYNALQQQLELSLQGFQYKNNLILEQAAKKTELENTYYNRYLDVLNQINTENAMAEEVRQFEENQKFQAQQAQFNRDFQSQQAQLDRDFQAAQSQLTRNFQAQQADLDRKHESEQAELNRKHDFALLEAKTKAEKELLDKQHAQAMAKLKKQQQYEKDLLKQKQEYELEQIKKQKKPLEQTSEKKATISAGKKKQIDKLINDKMDKEDSKNIVIVNSPLTAEGAAQKVASGELIVTKQEGNRVWVARNPNYVKGQATLNKYTWLK